jgi:hypothetical protein
MTGEFAVEWEFILIKSDCKINYSVLSSVDPDTDTEILRRGIESEKPEIEVRTQFTATASSRVSPMTAFQSPLSTCMKELYCVMQLTIQVSANPSVSTHITLP